MKKAGIWLLGILLIVSMSGCGGCKKKEAKKKEPVNKEKTAKPEEITLKNDHKGEMVSNLTGEWIKKEKGTRRPVAVMLNNIQAACPQTGISKAGVIYEAPVEGAITRLMGIFEDYDDLKKIGSVRSCRNYYISYAKEFDAIYAHIGESSFARPVLSSGVLDHLSGTESIGNTVYYRTSDRKAPHNTYTSFEGLSKGIEQKGYRTDYEKDHTPHYQFAKEGQTVSLKDGAEAKRVSVGYRINHPYFVYDDESGLYSRFQYGAEQIDDETGKQLKCTNIILQYSDNTMYDSYCLNIDTTSGGEGKFITGGKAIDVTWKKESQWGRTIYYDKDGKEITLNPGKTWVCIVLNSQKDAVEISAKTE